MHHAPAGPSRSARAAGFLVRARFRTARLLAPLATVIGVLRRMRVLPLSLAALTLGSFAVAAPLAPYDDDARGTAALSSTAGDANGLVPATGDGWTQDGAPAVPPPSDAGSPSSSSDSSSSDTPSPASSSSASSAAAVAPADDPAPARGTVSSPTDTPATTPSDTPSPDTSAPTASEESDEPAAPSPADPEVVRTTLDPADEALSAVNDARTSAGCGALTPEAGLAARAAEHSAALSDDEDADTPSSGDETWAVATGSDPSAVAGDWLDDEDLLDCGLTSAGVGTVAGFWTLVAA